MLLNDKLREGKKEHNSYKDYKKKDALQKTVETG